MVNSANKVLRFLLLGPIAGALAGGSVTCAGVIVWVFFGEPPDFYFRGWWWVEATFILQLIVGSIVGVLPGAILITFEHEARRVVRLLWFLVMLPLAAFVISVPWVYIEFIRHRSFFPLWPQSLTVVLCCALGPLLSRSWTERDAPTPKAKGQPPVNG
jgi:hypothetical protein